MNSYLYCGLYILAKSTSSDDAPKPPPPTAEASGDVMSKMSELIPYTPVADHDENDDWD